MGIISSPLQAPALAGTRGQDFIDLPYVEEVVTLNAPEMRDEGQRFVTTRSGIEIGCLHVKPAAPMSRDAELIQRALLRGGPDSPAFVAIRQDNLHQDFWCAANDREFPWHAQDLALLAVVALVGLLGFFGVLA